QLGDRPSDYEIFLSRKISVVEPKQLSNHEKSSSTKLPLFSWLSVVAEVRTIIMTKQLQGQLL
ncbi:MAG: hypothetical protein ACREGA_00760, partial [Candidatus Saccharimonadales bacterium]